MDEEASDGGRAGLTEASPAASILPSPNPTHPLTCAESVEQFYQSLRDKYLAQPTGPEGTVVEMDLVRVRLEKSSGKSQERELATLDWAERQPARGGLAEVLLAASDRQQPRETRVIAVLGKAGHGKSHWARAVSQAWAQ